MELWCDSNLLPSEGQVQYILSTLMKNDAIMWCQLMSDWFGLFCLAELFGHMVAPQQQLYYWQRYVRQYQYRPPSYGYTLKRSISVAIVSSRGNPGRGNDLRHLLFTKDLSNSQTKEVLLIFLLLLLDPHGRY